MKNNKLAFIQVFITKEELLKLLPKTANRFLMLTNMIRDMDLLRKLLLFADNSPHEKKILRDAYTTISFFLTKILISKTYEIWQFIDRGGIKAESENFSGGLKDTFENVKKDFEDNKTNELFCFIRNKLGFHYERREDIEPFIQKAIKSVGDFEMWLSETSSGNDIFSSSNTIMMSIVLEKMKEVGFSGEDKALIGTLVKLALDSSHRSQQFCKIYSAAVILKKIKLEEKEKIEIPVPLLSEVSLPLIVKSDK